jgi:hypothetical protein
MGNSFVRSLLVGAIALGVATAAQAIVLTNGNTQVTVNLPGISAETGNLGLNSLQTNVGGLTDPPDLLEHIDGDDSSGYANWFFLAEGAGNKAALGIETLGGGALGTATASQANFSYGSAGGTQVNGNINVLSDDIDMFESGVLATLRVTNNSASAQEYSLVLYQDYALTKNVTTGSYSPDVDATERIGSSGPSSTGRTDTFTQTDFFTHPSSAERIHSVVRTTLRGVGDVGPTTVSVGGSDRGGDGLNSSAPDIQTLVANLGKIIHRNQADCDASVNGCLPAEDLIEPTDELLMLLGDTNADRLITSAPDVQASVRNLGNDTRADFVQVHEDAGDASDLIAAFIQANVDLNDTTSVTESAGGEAGDLSGRDLASAFQVDFILQPGKSLEVQQVIEIAPEPASLALLGMGMTMLLARRSRRS